ncbi:MAG: Uma2 family endonuclease [Plectolyngbya sp. WJT66-NPBG17]|jgi:Uma2 family endonuclease|nr:Uma2 family endonuclease [Plectolyngbya sp. WJT66-NPBG17]MBW4524175.1 Uma2 family endonuclease [Phormidium tanganyikae FI6-MK23]
MGRKPTPTEKRVTLSGVSWQSFGELLNELGQARTARLTYERGRLEMMTPLEEHDRCLRLIESLILVLADELYLKIYSIGSVLLTLSDLGRAIQPDAAYSLEEVRLQKRAELDMNQAAPPDLTIEVAIGKGAIDRESIYASMGVPEIWRYTTTVGDDVLKGDLQIYQLQGERYLATANSKLFPALPGKRVLEFLEQSDTIGLAQALIVLREWCKEQS